MIIDSPIISGSLLLTGSFNLIGNTAQTGSLNISGSVNTIGTITATTLVVQTITSSISAITGSTKFGTLSTNTHQFTGSVNITGSTNLTGQLNGTDGTFFNSLTLAKNQNGFTSFYIENVTGGTASGGSLLIRSDFGSDFAAFGKFSTLTSSNGIISAKDVYIATDNGSVALVTNDAAGTIKMAAGASSTSHFTIASNGAATFSSSVTVGGGFNLTGNQKLYTYQDVAGQYTLIGSEYAPGNGNNKAEVRFGIESNTNTFLSFATALGPGTINERMRITSGGEVCVGTTSALLTTPGRGNLTINGTDSSILTFGNAASYSGYIYSTPSLLELDAQGGRSMDFNTNGQQRMRITSGGNVLIGSSTSKADGAGKLQVTGGIHASTGYYTTGVSQAISALNTNYVIRAGAYSGLIVIRDNTNGGSGVWLADPNMGFIQIANNMPGTFVLSYNGNTVIQKTSGNAINIGVAFYSNEFYS